MLHFSPEFIQLAVWLGLCASIAVGSISAARRSLAKMADGNDPATATDSGHAINGVILWLVGIIAIIFVLYSSVSIAGRVTNNYFRSEQAQWNAGWNAAIEKQNERKANR